MAIQKKSLISNFTAAKKAIIATKGVALAKGPGHTVQLGKQLAKGSVSLAKHSGVSMSKRSVSLAKGSGVSMAKRGVSVSKAGVSMSKRGVSMAKAGVSMAKGIR
jgi:hypothetical protein